MNDQEITYIYNDQQKKSYHDPAGFSWKVITLFYCSVHIKGDKIWQYLTGFAFPMLIQIQVSMMRIEGSALLLTHC